MKNTFHKRIYFGVNDVFNGKKGDIEKIGDSGHIFIYM
jgi:hypothetical protein